MKQSTWENLKIAGAIVGILLLILLGAMAMPWVMLLIEWSEDLARETFP